MKRREFITLLGGALVTWPSYAGAERASKVARIGFLVTGTLTSAEQQTTLNAFRQGLRERGYVEGQNIAIEYRAADGRIERFPNLARELVGLNPDLIVASNTPAARAAKEMSTTIPIVVPVMGDPVGDGLVTSLARPGGNLVISLQTIEANHLSGYTQSIPLRWCRTGFGGNYRPRPLSICNCGRSITKLYFNYGSLRCRRCANAVYASQARSKRLRPILQAQRIRTFLELKSYMWKSTGQRLKARLTLATRQDLKSRRLAHHSIQIPFSNYSTRGAMRWR